MKFATITNIEPEKTNYLILGIQSYNTYLQKSIKLQINNIERLYSRILVQQSSSKEDPINGIYEAFKSGNKLKPIGCLSGIWKSKDQNKEEEFLIKESPKQILQTWGTFTALIIPVITVVITVVQFLLKYLWNIGGGK
jgi:hypothetical protein